MIWEPMHRALFRVARAGYHRWGRFQIIDELGIMREEDYWRVFHVPSEAWCTARFLALMNMATFLGRHDAPCEDRMRQKVMSFQRLPSAEGWIEEQMMRSIPADDNNPAAKKLMAVVDEKELPPRWRRKRKRAWVAETPLGSVTYEWDIELRRDTHPDLVLWVENGPRGAVYPYKLFSIAKESNWLIFDDLREYERQYRAFLTLLNVFIDELREMGERFEATGRFD
jgi:hypothetical protein